MIVEAFSLIRNQALAAALTPEQRAAGEALPRRIKVLAWGTNDTVKGPVVLESLSVPFAQTQRSQGRERVAIDFEHNTLPGTTAYQESAEPRTVAGYGTPCAVPGEGLYLDEIEWTPAGIASALNYEDLSPAPFLDDHRRVTGLHSVALTRAGAVHGLHFFSAPLSNPASKPPESIMTEDEKKILTDLVAQVQALSARIEAYEAPKTEVPEAHEAPESAVPEKDKDPEGLSAPAVAVLQSNILALSASVTALSTSFESLQRDTLIAEATRAGKVIPFSAADLADMPPAKIRSLLTQLPTGAVPLSSATPAVKSPEALSVTTALESVAKATGFSVAQLRAKTLTPETKDK